MNEDEYLKSLFNKADIKYEYPDFKSLVLERLERQAAYQKKKLRYKKLGKLGLIVLALFGITYVFMVSTDTGNYKNNADFWIITTPFCLLIVLFAHLEFQSKPFKKTK